MFKLIKRPIAILTELFTEIIESKFTGMVTINFSQGGIAKIEKTEHLKVK